MERITLALATDDVLAAPLAATVASALMSKKPENVLDVHVISCGVSSANRARIIQMFDGGQDELTWHEVVGDDRKLLWSLYINSDRPYPPANYGRLLVGSLLPADRERVIYLDSDIVIRSDLEPLWTMPFGEADVLAVRDLPDAQAMLRKVIKTISADDRERFAMDPDGLYFQAGVLVMNLKAFRAGDSQTVLDVLRRYPSLNFPDQDALNIVYAQRHRLVDPRWNQMTAVYSADIDDLMPYSPADLQRLRECPFVIHYSGRPKPWEPGCDHPLRHDWEKAFAATPFAGVTRAAWHGLMDRVPRAHRVLTKKVRRMLVAPRA